MGESKRKRDAARVQQSLLSEIDLDKAAQAVHQVVCAVTDFQGADCLLYAQVGVQLLNSLGLPAQAVAGSAAWRVGDGDSDVISHAREIQGPQFGPAGGQALLFHAWVSLPGHIVDFSTATLAHKAKELDAADGGRTDVKWNPPYLCAQQESCLPPRQVLMAPRAGAYAYVRHADIEAQAFQALVEAGPAFDQLDFAVQAAYAALLRGEQLRVFGVDRERGDLQEAPASRPYTPRSG